MFSVPATAFIAIALFAGAWAAVALFLTWRAGAALGETRAARREAERLRALLAVGPAAALLVSRDGRIEAAGGAAALLGLPASPGRLDLLLGQPDGPFDAGGAEALKERIRAAMRAGSSGALILRPVNTPRILRIAVSPAPRGSAAGGALLWLVDVTAEEERAAASSGDAARQEAALAALSALIEAAPFPIWHRGPDLKLALVNSAYVAAVEGESAAGVVAAQVELIDEADGRNAAREAAEVRAAGAPAHRVVPATIAGERRTMQIVELPVGPAGVAGFAIDVEEREQARGELARFLSAQRDMLDRLSAGVAQFGRDRSLVFFNQPFATLFGLSADFLADRPEFDRVIDAMRDARKLPEPRDFPNWKAERRSWFTAGATAIEEDWELPDRRHLRVLAQPLPDGGLLAVFEDRTRQVRLESDRERMVQVQNTTFDNLAEGIAVFGSNRRLKLWNTRFLELWGLDAKQMADAPLVEALAAQLSPLAGKGRQGMLVRDLVRGATTNRRPRSGRLVLTDGRQFALAAIPVAGEDVLVTTLDVSDSHRVETALRERTAALEEADRLKTAFVSNISYELRTPLTSIAGFAEMMEAGYAGKLPASARDYVTAILTSVGRLSALIDDILDLTQSDTGGLLLAEEEVDVGEMVEALVEEARAGAEAKRLTLTATAASSAGEVTGDRRRLGQAIGNILRNAIQYTPEGGTVTVAVGGDEAAARILVSDTGPGIAPSEQTRIFDRFQRSAGTEGGAGLGLPLARQFVEAHGGSIYLRSEPGKGAVFTISLPRTAAQQSAYVEAQDTGAAASR